MWSCWRVAQRVGLQGYNWQRSLYAHKNNPSAFVQRFSGGQRFILDYVQEEILQYQPVPVQRFLLQVAVLSRMYAALCQALTEEPASQGLLETLERSNLFVVPLDEQRQWYRLHALFREVLLARLQATQPELVLCFDCEGLLLCSLGDGACCQAIMDERRSKDDLFLGSDAP